MDHFQWPNMQHDARINVKTCHSGQPSRPSCKAIKFEIQRGCGLIHTFSMDFAASLLQIRMGNRYVLIAVENLKGWPTVGTTKFQTALILTLRFELKLFDKIGSPIAAVTDNCSAFSRLLGNMPWQPLVSEQSLQLHTTASQWRGRAHGAKRKNSYETIWNSQQRDWERNKLVVEQSYWAHKMRDGFSPFSWCMGLTVRYQEVTYWHSYMTKLISRKVEERWMMSTAQTHCRLSKAIELTDTGRYSETSGTRAESGRLCWCWAQSCVNAPSHCKAGGHFVISHVAG